jgi:hypothetical protein
MREVLGDRGLTRAQVKDPAKIYGGHAKDPALDVGVAGQEGGHQYGFLTRQERRRAMRQIKLTGDLSKIDEQGPLNVPDWKGAILPLGPPRPLQRIKKDDNAGRARKEKKST